MSSGTRRQGLELELTWIYFPLISRVVISAGRAIVLSGSQKDKERDGSARAAEKIFLHPDAPERRSDSSASLLALETAPALSCRTDDAVHMHCEQTALSVLLSSLTAPRE